MSDFTPLERKTENAVVTYLDSILASMSLTGTQVVAKHQDTEALEGTRIVVSASGFSPRAISLHGVMDGQVSIEIRSQGTDSAHQTLAATVVSWLNDYAAVSTGLNTATDFHCYLWQFAGSNFEAPADDGTLTTTVLHNVIVQGAAAA